MSQLASHNKFKHKLYRDSSIIVLVTFGVLILSGICGIAIVDILNQYGYVYEGSSFGKIFFETVYICIHSVFRLEAHFSRRTG